MKWHLAATSNFKNFRIQGACAQQGVDARSAAFERIEF